MTSVKPGIVILMADDDEDDRKAVEQAFVELKLNFDLRFAVDGADIIDYLFLHRRYKEAKNAPRPSLILLDLNMPRKNGHQVLEEIRSDKTFHSVPIIVFSASKDPKDIAKAYELGANAFIPKPATFDGFKQILTAFQEFWT